MSHLTWAKGGHARVRSVVDDTVELSSTTSAPPGARLEATLSDGTVVKVKSYGTRKEADGTFHLKGRLLDATKELRARLAALSEGSTPPSSV